MRPFSFSRRLLAQDLAMPSRKLTSIMIHGQSRGFGWWAWLFQMFDWTNGCIAVTDEEMTEIWDMVKNGTPIEINP